MTDDELKAIEERCAKASRGPWEVDDVYGKAAAPGAGNVVSISDVDGQNVAAVEGTSAPNDNASFITHARADVPALIAEVRMLGRALTLIQWGSCDGCGANHYCPECGGENPADHDEAAGHALDCVVGKAFR